MQSGQGPGRPPGGPRVEKSEHEGSLGHRVWFRASAGGLMAASAEG